jgi:hypothetical protein
MIGREYRTSPYSPFKKAILRDVLSLNHGSSKSAESPLIPHPANYNYIQHVGVDSPFPTFSLDLSDFGRESYQLSTTAFHYTPSAINDQTV